MIVTETVDINGKKFTRTYSDKNNYIECDGVTYSEAFDLAELNKEYTETDVSIETGGADEATEADYKAQAYDILMGVTE